MRLVKETYRDDNDVIKNHLFCIEYSEAKERESLFIQYLLDCLDDDEFMASGIGSYNEMNYYITPKHSSGSVLEDWDRVSSLYRETKEQFKIDYKKAKTSFNELKKSCVPSLITLSEETLGEKGDADTRVAKLVQWMADREFDETLSRKKILHK